MKMSRTVSETAISALVLLVLAVAGGVAYTYFLGPRDGGAQVAPAPVSRTLKKPPVPAADALEGVSVQTLTTPVPPGANAAMTVRTLAASRCTISVIYNNIPSNDSGLAPKPADEYGTAGWSWTVPASTPVGKWPVMVTCTFNGRSAVVKTEIEVAK